MKDVPLFIVPDVGPHEGLLDPKLVEPIQRWLGLMAGPERSRTIILRTLKGALGALPEWVMGLVAAVEEQGTAAFDLRNAVELGGSGRAARRAHRRPLRRGGRGHRRRTVRRAREHQPHLPRHGPRRHRPDHQARGQGPRDSARPAARGGRGHQRPRLRGGRRPHRGEPARRPHRARRTTRRGDDPPERLRPREGPPGLGPGDSHRVVRAGRRHRRAPGRHRRRELRHRTPRPARPAPARRSATPASPPCCSPPPSETRTPRISSTGFSARPQAKPSRNFRANLPPR